ncbi:MAG: M20/M25/M40 family metallo-hydrolase [Planctomycetaceae bacterium]|nr:M20/M25/M40 family metallo-hydrolase [Planctomycetaceae bacterium]
MRRFSVITFFVVSGFCVGLFQLASAAESNIAANKQDEAEIHADLTFLASDEREGRDTGSPQILESAYYIQKQFQSIGLTTPQDMPDGLQSFTIPGPSSLGDNNLMKVTIGHDTSEWKIKDDYKVCSFGGAGDVSGEVVFCGYGIVDKENNYDEFAGIDLKGKIALIIRRVPRQEVLGSLYMSKDGKLDTQRAALRSKLQNAQKNGAIAMIMVNDLTSTKEGKDVLIPYGYGGDARGKEIPVFQITQKRASQLLQAGLNKSLEQVVAGIDAELKPQSQLLNRVSFEGKTDIQSESIEGLNVIGILEPKQASETGVAIETVVIGAHYDHVGWGGRGSLAPGVNAIHNGADDNASGTTALLEVARRIAASDEKFTRRFIFIAFSAEEKGLLGSKYYVKHPIVPNKDCVAMINLDMVGRIADEKLTVFGVGSSSIWNKMLDVSEKNTGLKFFRENKAFGPSDHASFYEKKIPVLHLFSGLHEDYHRPTDDIEDVNVQGIRRTVDVLEHLALEVARAPKRPDYIENKKWINVGRHAGGRSRIGLIPDLNFSAEGFALLNVEKNSPAGHAGLKAGDVLVEVNETAIKTRQDFWSVVDPLKPKTQISVKYRRGEDVSQTEVKLGNPR